MIYLIKALTVVIRTTFKNPVSRKTGLKFFQFSMACFDGAACFDCSSALCLCRPQASCLLSYATAVSCPAKKELHPPPVPVLLMSVFFSVLCKSGTVFLCIWRHCKFVSVILYVGHFISPRVNAKHLNLHIIFV